jgi:hypothetical protein
MVVQHKLIDRHMHGEIDDRSWGAVCRTEACTGFEGQHIIMKSCCASV